MVADAAEQYAEPDHTVADDHDRREYRVAREQRLVIAARQHHRDDKGDLDDRDGDRQDQRAERLAGAMGDHLRVMYRGQHARDERRTEHHNP